MVCELTILEGYQLLNKFSNEEICYTSKLQVIEVAKIYSRLWFWYFQLFILLV